MCVIADLPFENLSVYFTTVKPYNADQSALLNDFRNWFKFQTRGYGILLHAIWNFNEKCINYGGEGKARLRALKQGINEIKEAYFKIFAIPESFVCKSCLTQFSYLSEIEIHTYSRVRFNFSTFRFAAVCHVCIWNTSLLQFPRNN